MTAPGERPLDRFQREKDLLEPVAGTPYDTRICRSVYVTHQARVLFQTNTYTVPPRFVGQTLVLKAGPDRVAIYDRDVEVASHVRSYGRHRDVEDPDHTRAILKTKARGRADKERDELLSLGPVVEKFLENLVCRGQGSPDHHVTKLVDLVRQYGATAVLAAMDKAAAFGAFGADYVQNILYQRHGDALDPGRPNPVSLTTRPDLAEHSVETPDLAEYGHLTNFDKEDEDDDGDTRGG